MSIKPSIVALGLNIWLLYNLTGQYVKKKTEDREESRKKGLQVQSALLDNSSDRSYSDNPRLFGRNGILRVPVSDRQGRDRNNISWHWYTADHANRQLQHFVHLVQIAGRLRGIGSKLPMDTRIIHPRVNAIRHLHSKGAGCRSGTNLRQQLYGLLH
jgi:hypothetical protein